MYLSKTIKVKLYDTDVQFIISNDIAKVYNRIQKKHNTNSRWKDSPAGAMVGLSMDKYYILINESYLSYNTILHELWHCVSWILNDRFIHNEENSCWLAGLLGQEVFNFLKTKNILL